MNPNRNLRRTHSGAGPVAGHAAALMPRFFGRFALPATLLLAPPFLAPLLPSLLLSTLLWVPGMFAMAQAPSAAEDAPVLLQGGTQYPRVIRLTHGAAAANGRLIASTDAVIFQSLDDGRSFTRISAVAPTPGSKRVCCSTLYEVPRPVGMLAAGTLISAGTYAAAKEPGTVPATNGTDFGNSAPAIELYTSTDSGMTWRYLATPVSGGPRLPTAKPIGQRGLWEPEFELAADGALVLFVSDETDPCCSQKLIQLRTYDGLHWQDQRDIIAMPALPAARPGMIVSTPLPSGRYFMSYEICGDRFGCDVYTRTSADGWNFGRPTSPGTRAVTASGQFLRHSPANTFAPSPTSGIVTTIEFHGSHGPVQEAAAAPAKSAPSQDAAKSPAAGPGQILLIGQMLYEADGTVSPQNGRVYLTSTGLSGMGPWMTHPAPVPVPSAYDNFCPNYSSALLPSQDGTRLLELASSYDAGKTCVTYFRTAPLR